MSVERGFQRANMRHLLLNVEENNVDVSLVRMSSSSSIVVFISLLSRRYK